MSTEDRFLVDLGDLRERLQARAEAEGKSRTEAIREAVARYLTPVDEPPSPDPHEVRVMLDDDMLAWLKSWWSDREVGEVTTLVLSYFKAVEDDQAPGMTLVPLDSDLHAWLGKRPEGPRAAILRLLYRAQRREEAEVAKRGTEAKHS